jgi:hypothetical protein
MYLVLSAFYAPGRAENKARPEQREKETVKFISDAFFFQF